jgi:hypothetical protein
LILTNQISNQSNSGNRYNNYYNPIDFHDLRFYLKVKKISVKTP